MLKKFSLWLTSVAAALSILNQARDPSIETDPKTMFAEDHPASDPINPIPLTATGIPSLVLNELKSNDSEEDMVADGMVLANAIVGSECFKSGVLAANFTERNGLDNKGIYDLIRKKETPVNIKLYTGSWKANHVSRTIGYEKVPFDGWTYMNRYFVDTPYMVAQNIVHEALGHSNGFHHYKYKPSSVPYTLGTIFKKCYKESKS